ncbi:MAG: N-acetylmuramic acid 6-phosphate etherase [Clostridia bacterium]|nr:N-acetylmuramic acid 6-phosphate etherase [Clostridia bacterium]MBQ4339218.1 N-acetylmuramic acid 6-phosphate etherase [Clostridia bacterium]
MLKTEMRNPRTVHIDRMPTLEIVKIINDENNKVTQAIEAALPEIAQACDAAAFAIKNGGRVFYIGSGTSGRLAVCDAAECPPTFGVPYGLFKGIIAGGEQCMFKAAENAEDNPEMAINDLKENGFCDKDILIGISASGSAAYVISAVEYAESVGGVTVSIVNNPDTPLGKAADINICADTGPEVITGSTRMKAGTAQKIILNMISTASMVKCGCVYENMMINLRPTNKKLRRRMVGITQEILGCDDVTAEKLLEESDWSIRKAVEIESDVSDE